MHQALKDAITICKTFLRNGYDAHVINAPLQEQLLKTAKEPFVDIACEPNFEKLIKVIPKAIEAKEKRSVAELVENGITFRFYPLEVADASHPELSLVKITPTIAEQIPRNERRQLRLTGFGSPISTGDPYEGFANVKEEGLIRLAGIPDDTLRHNYLLAVRALRYAANYDLEIEQNTWLAIIRSSVRVLDYVPTTEIMKEWRSVAAESLHKFVGLLYDAHILQGLIPEVAALTCIPQEFERISKVDVFRHTLDCMKYYPEENFHHDWLGTMAMLFHDVGKLFTGEFINGHWSYYQHHRVGAKVTRKILRRLHFNHEDIDLLCHLVNHHMHFHFMMTDRGIRKFTALSEYKRLIAMAKADLKANEGSTTSFNHNMKYLNRAETPEQMLEPLMNGNEIMQETGLAPGPLVGVIREALLQAQISGEVSDINSAKLFVKDYARRSST